MIGKSIPMDVAAMATLRQKSECGTWYITYRENFRQKVRSLHATSRTKAATLRDEIEALRRVQGRTSPDGNEEFDGNDGSQSFCTHGVSPKIEIRTLIQFLTALCHETTPRPGIFGRSKGLDCSRCRSAIRPHSARRRNGCRRGTLGPGGRRPLRVGQRCLRLVAQVRAINGET